VQLLYKDAYKSMSLMLPFGKKKAVSRSWYQLSFCLSCFALGRPYDGTRASLYPPPGKLSVALKRPGMSQHEPVRGGDQTSRHSSKRACRLRQPELSLRRHPGTGCLLVCCCLLLLVVACCCLLLLVVVGRCWSLLVVTVSKRLISCVDAQPGCR